MKFWSECILTVVFIINRTSNSVLGGKTPYELITCNRPKYSMFKNFGCLAYMASVSISDKFVPRAIESVFFGYVENKKACKFYDLRTHQFLTSRDVKFHEGIFSFKLIDNSVSDSDRSFMHSFPFYDSDLGLAYVDKVPDKVDDSSISHLKKIR